MSQASHDVTPGFTPPTLEQLKHFFRFLAQASRGQLDDKPNVSTMRSYVNSFHVVTKRHGQHAWNTATLLEVFLVCSSTTPI
jgi:hypothetical protein